MASAANLSWPPGPWSPARAARRTQDDNFIQKQTNKSKSTTRKFSSSMLCFFGGGEENRTPVRKFIHIGISECSLSFPFPYPVADKQAKGLGILLYIVHAGGTLRRRSPLIDARIRIRGPIRPDGCLIKQQMQRYCCRLILSVRFLRGPAPLLASHASKSPSRPLRPQIFDAISFLFCFLIV